MAGRNFLMVVALGVCILSGPAAAQQDQMAQVRRIFETDIRLFNGQDPSAFTAAAHDQAVLFGTLTPFAVEGKPAIRQLIRQYFADHDYAKWEPVDAKFSITGTSALAWGHYTLRQQRRVGPRRVLHGRYTFTYTRQAGEWLLVALDFSPLS